MATVPTITTIQKTECIGNSLVTLTDNFNNIRNSFTDAVADFNSINNTLNSLITLTNSISSAQLAKAWVKFSGRLNSSGNFDSTNSPRLIYKGYNVSSVSKVDEGDYLITLQTPINADFVVNGMVMPYYSGVGSFTGTDLAVINLDESSPFPNPTQSCQIIVRNLLGARINPALVNLTFFSN